MKEDPSSKCNVASALGGLVSGPLWVLFNLKEERLLQASRRPMKAAPLARHKGRSMLDMISVNLRRDVNLTLKKTMAEKKKVVSSQSAWMSGALGEEIHRDDVLTM